MSEPSPFEDWKRQLLRSAGDVQLTSPILRLGDFVLELFWRDGCEPTVGALLDYAQGGLCNSLGSKQAHAAHRMTQERRSPSPTP